MTDPDVLRKAAAAMREQYDGKQTAAGFTRARIMRSLQTRRRRSFGMWGVLTPAALLFIGSTAWASATGRLPQWVEHVVAAVRPAPVIPAEAPRPVPVVDQRVSPPVRSAPLAPSSVATTEVPQPSSELQVTSPQPTAGPSLAGKPARPAEPARVAKRVAPAAVEAPVLPTLAPPSELPPPVRPPPDPEIAAFRHAHQTHFGTGSPQRAIAEYQRYLASYPTGRFVPEARYNIALNWVKLGRHAEARQALSGFALGHYGPYRRAEARALLEALDVAAEQRTRP